MMTITKPTNKPRRYHVRSVGSDQRSTIHDTFRSLPDAEWFKGEMEKLNPGVAFEIVDLLAQD